MRAIAFLAILMASGPVLAQADRYELGLRTRAFEAAWDEKIDDVAAKKRASPIVNQAVQSFFRLDLRGVGKSLDAARYALAGEALPPAHVRWGDSLRVAVEARAFDASLAQVPVTIQPFYDSGVPLPAGAVVKARLGKTGKEAEAKIESLPTVVQVPAIAIEKSEDVRLLVDIVVDGTVVSKKSIGLSRITDFSKRLEAVRPVADALPNPPKSIEQASLKSLVQTLTELEKKGNPETDYPASRLMAGAEALVRNKDAEYYTVARGGMFWLNVPTGKSTTMVRVSIPPERKGVKESYPVLVALHGMGGSENMYFDAYGAGVVPRMAAERRWFVIAPRVNGLLGAGPAPDVASLLDELGKRYPLDMKRVFVVGHSMGAGHALQLTQKMPERFTAVAALGGGGRVGKADAIKNVPFFVGCGANDFALSGAKALHQSIESGGGKSTFKEYADIEHLLIVREAAEDVFKFFDGFAKK